MKLISIIFFYITNVSITKVFILLITVVFLNQTIAGINLTTIDSFRISNMGSHSLMVSKKSATPDSQAVFFFQMERPFCLCEQPSFILGNPSLPGFERPLEDSFTKGIFRYNLGRSTEVEFNVYLARPEQETNVIIPINFPSLRNLKVLDIETVYGKERFLLNGFSNVMKQSESMCQSFIPYEDEEVKPEEMDV